MIQVYVTGGTFDKDYNYITGNLFFRDTRLPDMLSRGRCTLDVDVKTLMMVDSLEITEADRHLISHNCQRTKAEQIVITHGTDRMVETAGYLAHEDLGKKTIVLVGVMLRPDSSPLKLPEGYSWELELFMQACECYSSGDFPTIKNV